MHSAGHLHDLIVSLRLQDDPLEVRDAGQSLSWDPVHVDVVVLQVNSHQGRGASRSVFTQRLHWNSTKKHNSWTYKHICRWRIQAYISSSKKDLSCRAVWFSMTINYWAVKTSWAGVVVSVFKSTQLQAGSQGKHYFF